MKVKQNGVWEFIPDGIRWKQNGFWEPRVTDYVLATDDDFSGETNGSFRYIGTDEYVEIPHVIKGVNVTSYGNMFNGTLVKGVKSTNKNVTLMRSMFYQSKATSIDVSLLDTSSVTNMGWMFRESQATRIDVSSFDTSSVTRMEQMFMDSQAIRLDLSSFDTSSVTNMLSMFNGSQATRLDLSSFDTSSVTEMGYMFAKSQATSLDLSSFDVSRVRYINNMFDGSQATIGYVRTQVEADRLNRLSNKPTRLTFVVKKEKTN